MSAAEQAELVATIRLKDQFLGPAAKVAGGIKTLDSRTQALQRQLGKLNTGLRTGVANAAKIATVGIGALSYAIKVGIQETIEWEDATLQVNAAIASTGGAANLTAADVQALAQKYADLSLAEDDVVLSAEAVLLRFPEIKKKAFEPTLQAALDLAQATGTSVPNAAKTLARSLNDPAVGLSRLTRMGVTFTEGEQKKVKALAASGHQFRAQSIILDKVSKQYGGSAAKATQGYRGHLHRLQNALKDLAQVLVGPIVPKLIDIMDRLTAFAKSTEVQDGVKKLGEAVASLASTENLDAAFKALGDGLKSLTELDWTTLKAGFMTTADIATSAIRMFNGLPIDLQKALITLLAANKLTGGLVSGALGDIASFALKSLTTINAANVTVIGANVTGGPGGTPGGPAPIPGKGIPRGASALGFLTAIGGAMLINSIANADNPSTGNLTNDAGKHPGEQVPGGIGFGSLTNWEVYVTRRLIPAAIRSERRYTYLDAFNQGGGRDTVLNPNSPKWANEFISTSNKLYQQGEISAERFVDLNNTIADGTISSKKALYWLKLIKGAQGEVKDAVKGQKYQFLLKPSVTISASATGNAITFAANGQRLIIE
jgi:hypothetical protein